ncbi:hypothetical protein Lalb_Chr22g0355571 [Lupinus albus]|uniref:Uncharacterized protein n=1 Tax=Lupinus albus TaxID=3870 RepID=A0A6A4NHY8_LUPAL|nr:hypothetical protein Lalb_Chr22g0355571 [Lupinus albus]
MASAEHPAKKRKFSVQESPPSPPQTLTPPPTPPHSQDDIKDEIRTLRECSKRIKFYLSKKDEPPFMLTLNRVISLSSLLPEGLWSWWCCFGC